MYLTISMSIPCFSSFSNTSSGYFGFFSFTIDGLLIRWHWLANNFCVRPHKLLPYVMSPSTPQLLQILYSSANTCTHFSDNIWGCVTSPEDTRGKNNRVDAVKKKPVSNVLPIYTFFLPLHSPPFIFPVKSYVNLSFPLSFRLFLTCFLPIPDAFYVCLLRRSSLDIFYHYRLRFKVFSCFFTIEC